MFYKGSLHPTHVLLNGLLVVCLCTIYYELPTVHNKLVNSITYNMTTYDADKYCLVSYMQKCGSAKLGLIINTNCKALKETGIINT